MEKEERVYGYDGYWEKIREMYVEIDVRKEEDVMYGECVVRCDLGSGKGEMNDGVWVVRVKIVGEEYLGEGMVREVRIGNVSW